MAPTPIPCAVHGGTHWTGGYCERWAAPDAPSGPCVQAVWLDAGEVLANTESGANDAGWYVEQDGGYVPAVAR